MKFTIDLLLQSRHLLIAGSSLMLLACGSGGGGGNSSSLPAIPAVIPLFTCGGESFVSDVFAVGSIDSQHGWFSDPASSFDESVVNLGAAACRGKGVWKINNAVTSGGFGNQPQSPVLLQSAGESTVRSPGGGDTMEISFFIRTADAANADGSSFTLSLSPTIADRHTYLRFNNDDDADGGFQAFAIDGVNLDQTHVVKNSISRNQWHHIRIKNRNVDGQNGDGSANDVVEVYFDGIIASTHSTWEAWRVALPATTLAVSRTLFRVAANAGTVGAFAAPAGFYIDDYRQKIYDSANPGTILAEYKTGFEIP